MSKHFGVVDPADYVLARFAFASPCERTRRAADRIARGLPWQEEE